MSTTPVRRVTMKSASMHAARHANGSLIYSFPKARMPPPSHHISMIPGDEKDSCYIMHNRYGSQRMRKQKERTKYSPARPCQSRRFQITTYSHASIPTRVRTKILDQRFTRFFEQPQFLVREGGASIGRRCRSRRFLG